MTSGNGNNSPLRHPSSRDATPSPCGIQFGSVPGLILETYRIVLTEGRFISAAGFEILDEGSIAVPDKKKASTDGILTLALAWADEGCPADKPIE